MSVNLDFRATNAPGKDAALACDQKIRPINRPQGLKPNLSIAAVSARLKSYPDASCLSKSVYWLRVKSCPDAMPACERVFSLPAKRCICKTEIIRGVIAATALVSLAFSASMGYAQRESPPAQSTAAGPAPASAPLPDAKTAKDSAPAKAVRSSDRRKADRLYLAASKLYTEEKFEEALLGYEQAAKLDPENPEYPLAADVARSHAVTALIQAAARARTRKDEPDARAALARGLDLDPANAQLKQHLMEVGDDALRGETRPIYEEGAAEAGEAVELEPETGRHSFHLHLDQRQMLQQIFKNYGINATLDESVRSVPARFDLDNVDFLTATRIASLLTTTFFVPLDAHRALVLRDTAENRKQFTRLEYETVYLPGLTKEEMTDAANLAKNIFDVQQAYVEPGEETITLRAPHATMEAFNATMGELIDGHSQVLMDVRLIELAHTSDRHTGVQPPQSVSAYNLYSEEQSLLNSNQALVNQIISSGLVAPGDTLGILALLLASGQVTSSLFANGIATFGGGITSSALAPGKISANFLLNSSDSRELDDLQLRLSDNEEATLMSGTRYPIQTSSFSSLGGSASTIAGLSGAGLSSNLSSLLSNYGGSVPNSPQVQYQDLGLTLKATPRVLRGDEVAIKVDMKIDSLAGGSINGNPILSNRAWSGVVTVRPGESVEVVSELDRSESRAISGVPGLTEIPGMDNVTGKDTQKNFATLLIVMTPHVIRGTQAAGRSPMMRIERSEQRR